MTVLSTISSNIPRHFSVFFALLLSLPSGVQSYVPGMANHCHKNYLHHTTNNHINDDSNSIPLTQHHATIESSYYLENTNLPLLPAMTHSSDTAEEDLAVSSCPFFQVQNQRKKFQHVSSTKLRTSGTKEDNKM